MPLLCLPIHIWDRELDSRIMLAALAASHGHDVLIGHEYNIASLYRHVPDIYYLHNGRPTNSYRSRDWRRPIKENGGYTSLILEEGINDQSNELLAKQYVGVTEESLALVDNLFCCTASEQLSIKNYFNDRFRIEGLNSKMKVSSNTRFELLGDLGRIYFRDRVRATNALFGSFVLVSDNFGVEQFGGDQPLDQRPRYMNLIGDEKKVDALMEAGKQQYLKKINARASFCKMLNRLIEKFPSVLFIIRPHPVSDPRFWFNNVRPSRNSHIIYRDSVEPWIHGCSCVIHSGCTVGLQAELAGINAIDVARLIDDDRSSGDPVSTLVSSFRVQTESELHMAIKSSIRTPTDNQTLSELKKLATVEDRLSFNQTTLKGETRRFLGHRYGLPEVSALASYVKSIDHFMLGSEKYFSLEMLGLLDNQGPNPNKSRYFSLREIHSRFKAACKALGINSEIELFGTGSVNTFFLRRRSNS